MAERRDWIVYPWQVDAQVARWQHEHPDLLRVDSVRQYTNHRVYSLTITKSVTTTNDKPHLLVIVPHAHEPAGTAGAMNFINQLLNGKHLDGTGSTLVRDRILEEAVVTFVPDGNPYGRCRAPEPWWDGSRYTNREFINMVFGMSEVKPSVTTKPPWERFKRVSSFDTADGSPARVGLVFEQVSDTAFVEPFRFDPRASMCKILERLLESQNVDMVLNVHQTEFEDAPDVNCKAVLPGVQDELPEDLQETNRRWAEALHETWSTVGGRPLPSFQTGFAYLDRENSLHSQLVKSPLRERLTRENAFMTLEIQNNNPATPADQQLLLVDSAIWRSVEYLLEGS